MPIHKGKDKEGHYYQYGGQRKYYYNPINPKEERRAKKRATRQGQAINISKHK